MVRLHRILAFSIVVLLVVSSGVFAEGFERDDLKHYTLEDARGTEILLTGLMVSVGDSFLSEDNRLYRVVRLDGDRAIVEFIREIDLGLEAELPSVQVEGQEASWWTRLLSWIPVAHFVQGAGNKAKVAIYHTHSDESYEPTCGTHSIEGQGGILMVGEAFEKRLEQLGVEAIQDETSHDPHDANAYNRSRRTASSLLEHRPDLIVDVHRDTSPAAAYRREIAGQTVTQLMLVVGRQNPKVGQTDALAKKIKAVVDKKYAGLIRGIFYAKGNYNQDLSDRLILAEVGSHKNERAHAEAGIQLFASAVPDIIAALGGAQGTVNRTAGRTIIWLLLFTLVGGFGYLWLSTGSWEEAVAKLRSLGGREWGDVVNVLQRRKKRDDGPDGSQPDS